MMDAAGLSSALHESTNALLRDAADLADEKAERLAQPGQPPGIVRRVVGEVVKRGVGAVAGHIIGPMVGIPPGAAELIGSMIKLPIPEKAVEGVAKGPGWIPKTLSYLADNTADALRLAADDPDNMLATRGFAKQLFAKGIQRNIETTTASCLDCG
jgi:hypothetical protein